MKRHTINLITLGLLLLSVSSCNYLDVIPDNVPNIDHAFADRDAAEKYLFTCYSYLPNFYHPDNDPAMLGSGEMLLTIRLCWEDTRCILITGKRR